VIGSSGDGCEILIQKSLWLPRGAIKKRREPMASALKITTTTENNHTPKVISSVFPGEPILIHLFIRFYA
jgi:hypothetical protein